MHRASLHSSATVALLALVAAGAAVCAECYADISGIACLRTPSTTPPTVTPVSLSGFASY